MKKNSWLVLGILMAGAGVASAESNFDWTASGSHTVGKTTSYSMPEDGEVYLNLKGLKAGSAYTFVASGSGASVEVVYTYKEDGDLWDDTLASSSPDMKTEDQERCIVTSDDWISACIVKDPDYEYESGEWKELQVTPKGYYLHVAGDEGATITVASMSGAIEEPIPVGDADNPKTIAPAATPATVKANYVTGAYYFTIEKAKVGNYLFSTSLGTEESPVELKIDSGAAEYSVSNVTDTISKAGNCAYLITVTEAGSLEFHVEGEGSSFGLTHQYAAEGTLGELTVTTKGANGTWSIKGATGKYESGDTIGILGAQTVVFARVTGFATPTNMIAIPTESQPSIELQGIYNDTYDPKDDRISGKIGTVSCSPTKITPSAKVQSAARTLFEEDPADHFVFTAKTGVYYNFSLADLDGDAVMTVASKSKPDEILMGPDTSFAKLSLTAGDYLVKVAHADGEEPEDAQYALAYSSAKVGTVAFAKTAVSVKKSVGSVSLSVTRSSSEGKIRVRYGTVNDTAQPGVDYFAQQGELVWNNGDKTAKTITIKLIPEAFAEAAIERDFSVRLLAIEETDLEEDEYPAVFASGKDVAVITVTEAKAKAPTAVKAATTKTESVPLETGTYQGVITEDGSALTNGLPALASVTFTAKNSTKKALSASVTAGGKKYSFAANTWDAAESDATTAVAVMVTTQKVSNVKYENTLRISVARGATGTAGDWTNANAQVELTLNVVDASGKGVQENIAYTGELFRNNSKIQDYLYAVTNAVGYYTLALVPSGVMPGDGIPAGNGYLTLTLDNKGKAKVAGLLADGTTKPSYSSIVAVRDDGDTLVVPVFVAKSPYCFGGDLYLVRGDDGRYVVDASRSLVWNNDNAQLTYDGEEGWRMELDPVGGYFNTVNNLQSYYLTHDISVATLPADEMLAEALGEDYEYVVDIGPNESAVTLTSNSLSTEKQSLSKDYGNHVDFKSSVNPANVQVKLVRATGLVSGSFSLWTEDAEGSQKEIKNLKHNGILLLSRDSVAPIDDEVMTAGFFTQTVKLPVSKTKTRNYTASNPFNLIAVDQGAPDWYADDWGERPEEQGE